MGDPELVRLCQQVYLKHKRAFDLIYRHRPDLRVPIRSVVEGLIGEHSKLAQEGSSLDTLRFGVTNWDTPALLSAEGWTSTNRILMFVVYNKADGLELHLFLGPGPEATRQRILDMVRDNPEVFMMPRSLNGRWLPIFSRHLLRQEAYEDLDDEKRKEEIRRRWIQFIEEDLPRIEAVLKKETWACKFVGMDEGR